MLIYPLLTQAEQADLPQLIAAPTVLPSKFEDSTHQVWLCDTVEGRMVLKVCDHTAVTKSDFWLGLNHLFSADFPNSLGQAKQTYDLITKKGLCGAPAYVASSSNRFVLTRFVEGLDVDAAKVTDAAVVQLAKHIGQLHQHTQRCWGGLQASQYKPYDWGERLHATLSLLSVQSAVAIPEPFLQEVLAQASTIQETAFVPIMLDLRWDQFRSLAHNSELALIDLDAFVIGPCALELVLLEYVLTPRQFGLFEGAYTGINGRHHYVAQKSCYQLLLFLMQVLGETDLEKWMRQI